MSAGGAVAIRRLLLAFDGGVPGPEVFAAASMLAGCLDAELDALFIEDVDLLRLAALPFAHEVSLSSAARRRLQHPDIERSWRARAARAQAVLSQEAERRQLHWSFRVARGQLAVELGAALVATDLVAVTLSGVRPGSGLRLEAVIDKVARQASRLLLVLPDRGQARAPFVAVYEGTPASERALALAGQLARREGGELVVLLAASDAARRVRLRVGAEQALGPDAVAYHARALVSPDAIGLAAALGSLRPATLLVAADGELLRHQTAERLLQRFDCSVLVVG